MSSGGELTILFDPSWYPVEKPFGFAYDDTTIYVITRCCHLPVNKPGGDAPYSCSGCSQEWDHSYINGPGLDAMVSFPLSWLTVTTGEEVWCKSWTGVAGIKLGLDNGEEEE